MPAAPTSLQFVFFILGAGRQVRRINERDGFFVEWRVAQKFPKQMVVDLAETARPQAPPKIVEHAHIRNGKTIGQMREAAPLFLLGQAADQRIETKRAREQNQQMNTPELSRAETSATALAPLPREALIDEIIRNIRRENSQQFRRAHRWKLHGQHAIQ